MCLFRRDFCANPRPFPLRWIMLGVDIHADLEKILRSEARFEDLRVHGYSQWPSTSFPVMAEYPKSIRIRHTTYFV
jgi:hypothetical protein